MCSSEWAFQLQAWARSSCSRGSDPTSGGASHRQKQPQWKYTWKLKRAFHLLLTRSCIIVWVDVVNSAEWRCYAGLAPQMCSKAGWKIILSLQIRVFHPGCSFELAYLRNLQQKNKIKSNSIGWWWSSAVLQQNNANSSDIVVYIGLSWVL